MPLSFKKLCLVLSSLGAALISLPAIYEISRGEVFSATSYLLWALLSVVCLVTYIRAGKGGVWLMAGWFISELAIGITAFLIRGIPRFETYDWVIIGLVVVCAIVYVKCELKGNLTPAVIVNAIACVLSGGSQIVDSLRDPNHVSFTVCSLYVLICALAYVGEEKTLHGRLIPAIFFFYWLLIMGCSLVGRAF